MHVSAAAGRPGVKFPDATSFCWDSSCHQAALVHDLNEILDAEPLLSLASLTGNLDGQIEKNSDSLRPVLIREEKPETTRGRVASLAPSFFPESCVTFHLSRLVD